MGHIFRTDAIALASPSGRMSKRALRAAQERIAQQLFGPKSDFRGWGETRQSSERERGLWWAGEYELLASRGISPRKHRKAAAELYAKWL